MKRVGCCAIAAVLLVSTAGIDAADDAVSTARNLYAAAAYEDALVLLNRLHGSEQPADDARAIEQYRALCLLALGRRDDAEQAMAVVVTKEPLYQPSEADASPRVRSLFSEVRRRILPAIVQDTYAAAKAAYDRKDFVPAADGFKQVVALLADPGLGPAANQPPLADLRVLATGFRDLSLAAIPPAPAPEPPAPPAAIPTPMLEPERGRIYSSADDDVAPPLAIHQTLPPFEFQSSSTPGPGVLEVVIDETGTVIAALMRSSVTPRYDAVVIDAARAWQYKPATLKGAPVMYRKLISIAVKRSS